MGRELFAAFRVNALGAEQGACTFYSDEAEGQPSHVHTPVHDRFVFVDEDTRA
jgi:phosphogluconate dehydratase